MGEDYWLHALPWVTFVVTLFLFVFMCWIIYYSYLGTKMQNPTKGQSITTMIFAVIFTIIIFAVFAWSIFHLIKLYSKKKDIVTPPMNQDIKYGQNIPLVQDNYAQQVQKRSVSVVAPVPGTFDEIRSSDSQLGSAY